MALEVGSDTGRVLGLTPVCTCGSPSSSLAEILAVGCGVTSVLFLVPQQPEAARAALALDTPQPCAVPAAVGAVSGGEGSCD